MYLVLLILMGCVLDRTGQSASERFRRELVSQSTRLTNLEQQFDHIAARVIQLEELMRASGQDEILKMDTLDELRTELARVRGELEVLSHDYAKKSEQGQARGEDAMFRLAWLETRAGLLERALGLKTPAPPTPPAVSEESPEEKGIETDAAAFTETPAESVPVANDAVAVVVELPPETPTDPDAMLKAAAAQLKDGNEQVAEAVIDRFLELYPNHRRLPEALYRRAEARVNAGDYATAVVRFQEVIDRSKKSTWAPWAMLRQGECFAAQGQASNAKLFYEDLIRMWPKSKAAAEARRKLGR